MAEKIRVICQISKKCSSKITNRHQTKDSTSLPLKRSMGLRVVRQTRMEDRVLIKKMGTTSRAIVTVYHLVIVTNATEKALMNQIRTHST